MDVVQQILDLDSSYGVQRQIRGVQNVLYMRRRGQLLRESENTKTPEQIAIRKDYLQTRRHLLARRYGPVAARHSTRTSVELTSTRSSIDVDVHGALQARSSLAPPGVKSHRRTVSAHPSLQDATRARTSEPPLMYGHHSAPGKGFPSRTDPNRARSSSANIPEKRPASPQPSAPTGPSSRALSLDEAKLFYQFDGMQCVFDHARKAITAIKFANGDNDLVAYSCDDGTVQHIIWLEKRRRHDSDIAWAVTNVMLASVSLDCTLRLWQLVTGDPMKVINTQKKLLTCALCPLNNNFVLVGCETSHVLVFNASLGMQTKSGKAKASGAVATLTFDTSGRLVWSGDSAGVVHSFQFDVMTGGLTNLIRVIVAENHPITSLSFAQWATREKKEPTILMSCRNDTLYLLSVADSRGVVRQKRAFGIKHSKIQMRSAFCPQEKPESGACIVSGSEDGRVYIFNTTVGRKARPENVTVTELKGHPAPVAAVDWNSDLSLLASGDAKGTVIFWKRSCKVQPEGSINASDCAASSRHNE